MRIGSTGWYVSVMVVGVWLRRIFVGTDRALYWRCVAWYARCGFRHSCIETIRNAAPMAILVVLVAIGLLIPHAANRLGFRTATPSDWRWWPASALYCLLFFVSLALVIALGDAGEDVEMYAPADIHGAIAWVQNHPANQRDLAELLGPDKVLREYRYK